MSEPIPVGAEGEPVGETSPGRAGPPSTVECGCVVLSMGTRQEELRRALESVLGQRGVSVDCLVVGNGWEPADLPDGVRALALAENVGIPRARNLGAAAVGGEVVLFLDDDAVLAGEDFLARAYRMFADDPSIGLAQAMIDDPAGRPTPTRWVPRLRGAGKERSGDVTVVCEGATLTRRAVFEQVGGWAGRFFYGHEGIELAWRVMDAGYRVRYEASLRALHPATQPTRHGYFYYMTARNRVWIARRNLPAVLALTYVAVWTVATLLRVRRHSDLVQALRGFWHGASRPCGRRRPIAWGTVWRMTRAGRPPVV